MGEMRITASLPALKKRVWDGWLQLGDLSPPDGPRRHPHTPSVSPRRTRLAHETVLRAGREGVCRGL